MTTVDVRNVDPDRVWKALGLWIFKPSAHNKTIGTANFICADENQSPKPSDLVKSNINRATSYSDIKTSVVRILEENNVKYNEDFVFWDLRCGAWTILRLCLPKNGEFRVNSISVIQCDFDNCIIKVSDLRSEEDWRFKEAYQIAFDGKILSLSASEVPNQDVSRIAALFKLKVEKWIKDGVHNPTTNSLSLVSTEEYIILYNQLKKKYCESIRQIWTESTDPDKFIHEDVAIATYLILLWQRQPKKFVDLGCGNGLLVHILNSEGHRGCGIDVRRRKIWDSYPPSSVLKEETIVPTLEYRFPGVDWVIGNHSDELSPWIPVIAMLSSERTNFFLLPCCAFEFSGVKFKRTDSLKSVYMGYLDYLENLTRTLGFNVSRDRLKIPSTKRICLVSDGRFSAPPSSQFIKELVNDRCSDITAQEVNSSDLVANFQPRQSIEKVRNCTQLDRNFVTTLIAKISKILLTDASLSLSWQQGSPIAIPNLAEKLDRDDLLKLKSECGGLQTFLRNHRYIFQILNGKVNFRRPAIQETRPMKWKTKQCWFFNNHPQSCPLRDEECYFIH
ncbi:Predicted AdoMet-dependent methyltransferase [Nesidiocoris tenuis]|uniref:tRNA (uracil-O(2)-)-methyltransferase n=1 Tax=Nesidiocoris tenuis TaxID=355587 RepID=A0ABN7AU86_9HEMI|nr:Predicted AdoMet-dependent methyltransferase [Nesidiocoris tenuis]